MSGGYGAQDDVDIDLGGLVRAIWNRRGQVLLATVVSAGLAFAASSMIAPTFSSETRLLIEAREPAYTTGVDRSAVREPAFDELDVVSQVQLLKSADLIKQVARDMKLYELAEFDPAANPSALSDILVAFGLKKNPLDLPPEERVLKEFEDKLVVYQVEKSRVVAIQFTSEDPLLAAAIPNEMAKVYLSLQSGAKLDTNSEASRWLEPEIANLREKVREAEEKVAQYRSRSDLLPTGENATFAVKQLNDVSGELARVRTEKATAEARAESVRAVLKSGGAPDTLSDVVGSQMIQRLKESEAQIQGQVSDLSTSLLEQHPRLKGLRSQLAGIRAQITAETSKILASLENDARVARLREQQLIQQLNAVKADSARAGEDEVGLKALEREATAQRQLLETYLARYREATSRSDASSTPADARIISAAVPPTERQFPKVLPITIVGGLAGFLLSSVAILLAELFSGRGLRPVSPGNPAPDDDFTDEAEVERWPLVRADVAAARQAVAGAGIAAYAEAQTPDYRSVPAAYDAEEEEDAASLAAPPVVDDGDDGDDFTVTAVARNMTENDVAVAIAVSPSGDAGSAATVALARMIADRGRKTVLVDLTGSALPTRLMTGTTRLAGVTDLLVGDAAFADILHGDEASDAHVVARGNADIKRAMRGIDRLSMIVDALSDAYETVIVECGPADVAGVHRLTPSGQAEIILSIPGADEDRVVETIGRFADAGYSEIVLMTGTGTPPRPGRRAA
ncbi:Wzz/FepE/Etk N-terminal domain-containing protein [Rhizobium sp. TRM96647]|uniref:GumC family protein n=1 Tax=unclassified Rhizobium TaxID=2613769 RepID=UPI0021E79731|nr:MULTISPECIES: Wzz/FepE/Etk N-terminal domain-containing protein [unclassified Rhizobium]MCV3738226.1 Wzz/FepE/Etk N-terminal domain-containing protein [Rhizobium sp. TRM96647]MCV3760025.1 Wzz/FepE/Etk N-terminal domain-containing protein [Rhizobium sp. TRM96650]